MKYIILITGIDEFDNDIEPNFDPYLNKVFEKRTEAWDFIADRIKMGFIYSAELMQVSVVPIQIQDKTIN